MGDVVHPRAGGIGQLAVPIMAAGLIASSGVAAIVALTSAAPDSMALTASVERTSSARQSSASVGAAAKSGYTPRTTRA